VSAVAAEYGAAVSDVLGIEGLKPAFRKASTRFET